MEYTFTIQEYKDIFHNKIVSNECLNRTRYVNVIINDDETISLQFRSGIVNYELDINLSDKNNYYYIYLKNDLKKYKEDWYKRKTYKINWDSFYLENGDCIYEYKKENDVFLEYLPVGFVRDNIVLWRDDTGICLFDDSNEDKLMLYHGFMNGKIDKWDSGR